MSIKFNVKKEAFVWLSVNWFHHRELLSLVVLKKIPFSCKVVYY